MFDAIRPASHNPMSILTPINICNRIRQPNGVRPKTKGMQARHKQVNEENSERPEISTPADSAYRLQRLGQELRKAKKYQPYREVAR